MITMVLERRLSTSSSQRMLLMSVAEQGLRQQHAQLPARRHGAHEALVLISGNTQAA
jgi:hypothetical protein